MIDVTYFMADRQDATVSFVEKRPQDVVNQVARLARVFLRPSLIGKFPSAFGMETSSAGS